MYGLAAPIARQRCGRKGPGLAANPMHYSRKPEALFPRTRFTAGFPKIVPPVHDFSAPGS